MLRIAVCDDNIDELSNMTQLINLYIVSKNISCEYTAFSNGFELISALEKGKSFDIYCLDIIMPGLTGIDVAKELRSYDKIAPIIFFTSSPEFALDSYLVKAVNYVLKPVSKEKLFFTFDDVLDNINVKNEDDMIVVKSSEGIQRILISSLVFAEVTGRNVLYHLNSGKIIECTESFSVACDKLINFSCFMKTHRSYIVNMQYVDIIENTLVTLQNHKTVPVAQGKAKEIKQQYLDYQMEGE